MRGIEVNLRFGFPAKSPMTPSDLDVTSDAFSIPKLETSNGCFPFDPRLSRLLPPYPEIPHLILLAPIKWSGDSKSKTVFCVGT